MSFEEKLRAWSAQIQQQVGAAHAKLREVEQGQRGLQGENALTRKRVDELEREVQALASLTQGGQASGGTPLTSDHVKYIESIPGRRMPFDFVVPIPIGANVTATLQGTDVVSQDGPFIAVARYAAFQSQLQFSLEDDQGNTVTFNGRSFGRWRPVHSMWDLMDGSAGVFNPATAIAAPGTGAGIFMSPTSHSSFRTMQFDGLVEFLNQGNGRFRSNSPIPSAFYTSQINAPFELGAFDFFERGETLQWKVTPTHTNNPRAGSVQALNGIFPTLDAQYDVHEGILDPAQQGLDSDPVTRLPQGILWIGFHGLRIIQPPGPVSM